MAETIDVRALVASYIRLRDYKKKADDDFKASMERVNAAMKKLEAQALDYMSNTGAESIATEAGTVYRNTQYSATVQDKAAFREFVQQSGDWDALDMRANKTYVREMLDAGNIVPGVTLSSINTVGVRRS